MFQDDRKSDKAADKFLKKEMGLDVRMLPTTKNDKITSSLVRFTTNSMCNIAYYSHIVINCLLLTYCY